MALKMAHSSLASSKMETGFSHGGNSQGIFRVNSAVKTNF